MHLESACVKPKGRGAPIFNTRKTISVVHDQIQTMTCLRLELSWLPQYCWFKRTVRAARITLVLVGLILSANSSAFALQQESFDPFEGDAGKYHFDLGKNFFSNEAEELASREALTTDAKRLDVLTGRATKSGRSLLEGLEIQDRIQRSLGKHQA